MHLDANLANGDPTLAALVPDGVTLNHILAVLQTIHPVNGEQRLRQRLKDLGATHPANLAPPELAEFIKYLLGALKSGGIKDPAALLAYGVPRQANEAAAKLGASAATGNIAARPNSVRRPPITIDNNSPTSSVASLARPRAPRIAYETTKAEVLSRIKAAVDAGENLRRSAERLACAQQDFRASQREIARAVGRSASWVNRLLKWHGSGYKQSSPFGPTTRACRAARRKITDTGRRRGSGSLLIGASATGPNCETPSSGIREDSSDNGDVRQIDRSSASHQPSPAPPTGDENLPNRSIQNGVLLSEAAAAPITEVSKTPTENPDGECDLGANCLLEQQKQPSENPRAGQKRTLERMQIVVASLKEYPILARAAFKAGIHRKTLENWLKCSTAGHEGYDIECEGERYRFHDHCEFAIAEAHDTLHFLIWQSAWGIKYKIDPLLERLGYQGVEAYATDANGNYIEEGIRKPNPKMLRFYLEWKLPERWGKRRKRDIAQTGGVLIVGERTKRPKSSYEPSTRARQWKAGFSRL
jgi:hypothetical protein